jgi:CheY-like chemotaxis protein
MQPLTLLVIDPTGFKTESIRTALGELGLQYEIKYVPAVVQALSTIDAETALSSDLVILNFQLPYMNVSEAIRRLREVHSLIHTPMVVMAYNEWEVKHVPEADGILWLPVTTDGMQEVLELIRQDGASVTSG